MAREITGAAKMTTEITMTRRATEAAKMTKEIAICLGTSGSGKTSFAKAAREHSFFSFDDNFWDNGFDTFRRNLISFVEKNDKIIIDGWVIRDELTDLIKELERRYDLQYFFCIVVRDVQDIAKSWQEARGEVIPPPVQYGMILESIDYVINHYNSRGAILQLVDGNCYTHHLHMAKDSLDKILYSKIDFEEADRFINGIGKIYHNIDIGSKKYGGHKDCEETWVRIKSCVDFKDKIVLDLGCYYGFFSFKAEEYGAKKVIGFDYGGIPETTNKLAKLKNSKAVFYQVDLDYMDCEETLDIVLLLNVLHHTSAPLHILKQIFSKARETVIIEPDLPRNKEFHNQRVIELSEFKQRSQKGKGMLQRLSPVVYDEFAANYNFVNKKIIESTRPNRAIFIYSK
jgi:SAM-dependent methyltransferase